MSGESRELVRFNVWYLALDDKSVIINYFNQLESYIHNIFFISGARRA